MKTDFLARQQKPVRWKNDKNFYNDKRARLASYGNKIEIFSRMIRDKKKKLLKTQIADKNNEHEYFNNNSNNNNKNFDETKRVMITI